MAKEIRARFSNGKIEPLESIDLKEGDELVISVKEAHPDREARRKAFHEAAGAWKGTLDFDAYLKDIKASRKRRAPEVTL